MSVLQRHEVTTGPVATYGRTITLVARTRGVRFGGPLAGLARVQARPAHVEVLDDQGRRRVHRIHDVDRALTAVAVAAAVAGVAGVRFLRRMG